MDEDYEGDACDLDDGVIYFVIGEPGIIAWREEAGYEAWNLYRGDLSVLKATGEYTQVPGSNDLASRACGLSVAWVPDTTSPPPGKVAFFLVTGIANGVESGLGMNSAGVERPNTNPCP
jgi:hypothetical protein